MYASSFVDFKSSRRDCMFYTIGGCGNQYQNNSGILCDKHMDEVFSMQTVNDVLISKEGRNNLSKQVLTKDPGDNGPVLPFPYGLDTSPSPNKHDEFTFGSVKLCLNQDILAQNVGAFVHAKNLQDRYKPETINAIIDIIILWLSNGTKANTRSTNAMSFFFTWANTNKKLLSAYWRNSSKLYIVNGDTVHAFGITKLPVFYQAMLANIELSYYTMPNKLPINIVPNIIADATLKKIYVFNTNSENKMYLQTDNASFATPLVIAGECNMPSGVQHKLFSRVAVGSGDYEFLNAPTLCSI